MTPEQFCYWLQGFGELSGNTPTAEQWKSINEHLAEVFNKVTPPINFPRYVGPALPPVQPMPQPVPFQPYIHDPFRVTCADQIAGKLIKPGALTC